MKDLLHLETARKAAEQARFRAEKVGLVSEIAEHLLEALDQIEKAIESGDTSELESWAR